MLQVLIALNQENKETELLAALNFELPAGPPPEWLELIPAGASVVGRDGRKWLNDRPDAVIAAFNADGRDLVIDVEHATQLKAPNGDAAPAAGWVKAVEARNGAIWGRADWTPAGAATIANREYRYISPVFNFEPTTSRIVQLVSIGLTNRPNLRLTALNQFGRGKGPGPQEEAMLKKLLEALGLAEDATEQQATNAIAVLKNELAVAQNRAKTPDISLFVPRADYDQALVRATNAEKALSDMAKADLDAQIEREVGDALKAGKITPATKEYYTDMCRQQDGLAKFKKFVAAAPVIGDPSSLGAKPPENGTALNAEQLSIAAMFGNSAEDIAKYGK